MINKLSKQAKQIIKGIEETNEHFFITGKAGTGKSTLLEHIRLHSKKRIIVLAPTGISAINVNGETIHSFFTLKPGFELDEARKMNISDKMKQKLNRIKTIAIDEISMVRADLLDAVDTVLRRARKNNEPFGGAQMIFFGDLYQLPPVVTGADKDKFYSEYDAPYFFNADVFTAGGQGNLFIVKFKLKIIELKKIYRQKDNKFIEILNAVREDNVTDNHLNILNSRFSPGFIPNKKDKYIYLVTTNAMADSINFAQLRKLNQKEAIFKAKKTGAIAPNLYPNSETVTLRVGAQVMFICNDSQRRWVNGTIGEVIGIDNIIDEETGEEKIVVIVEKTDGKIVEVDQHTWEISRYVYDHGEFKRDIMGSYTQIPIKLAWAITIHKSQGKTFEKVIIDLGSGTFVHGQTYVALSRCTTLNGIVLKKKFFRSSIIMDQRVKSFGDN
ncbi:MAG TPA: DEAD/DEAH box helicase [Candidatus Bipolaricaulota bacterium]|nr:DEAD/DEAH box helicase [Candidatus Bipolaricaulota bacterium]